MRDVQQPRGIDQELSYGKAHEEPLHDITFVPKFEEITVDYEPGEEVTVKMHDGPSIRLKKLEREYDPTNKTAAMELLLEAEAKQNFITGLIYFDENRATIQDVLDLGQTPLTQLSAERLRPSREVLAKLNADLA